MSFASEFRKKYFKAPLNIGKRDVSEVPAQPARDGDHDHRECDGDAAAVERSEGVGADGDSVEAAQAEQPAAPDVEPESEPIEQLEALDAGPESEPAEQPAAPDVEPESEPIEQPEALDAGPESEPDEQTEAVDAEPLSERAEQAEALDAGPESEPDEQSVPAEQSDPEEIGRGTIPSDDDPEKAYQHEVIAPRPDVGPAETRTNFRHVLGAMVIAAALLAVLHSGALATYARGLPYGKVYERIITAAEVWHGYMERAGLSVVMTKTRDWVTAVRQSRWADIAGLVGLENAQDLDEAAVPLEDGTDLSSEMPEPGAGAMEDADTLQTDGGALPDGDSLPTSGPVEADR